MFPLFKYISASPFKKFLWINLRYLRSVSSTLNILQHPPSRSFSGSIFLISGVFPLFKYTSASPFKKFLRINLPYLRSVSSTLNILQHPPSRSFSGSIFLISGVFPLFKYTSASPFKKFLRINLPYLRSVSSL